MKGHKVEEEAVWVSPDSDGTSAKGLFGTVAKGIQFTVIADRDKRVILAFLGHSAS